MQQIPICSYSIWSHITDVMIYKDQTRSAVHVFDYSQTNGDMAPTPRSLQCKELTWQPTKHTFCKALSGVFLLISLQVLS